MERKGNFCSLGVKVNLSGAGTPEIVGPVMVSDSMEGPIDGSIDGLADISVRVVA